ncbi:VV A32-like packaging ATPase [uncultured virus]|nr:VV A32-like packaging ATPase [uncultured virus]
MNSKNVEVDGSTVPIRPFLLDSMVPNPSICMIAKRGSGKSWVVRSLLKHFKHIPGGIIIAPTDKMSAFYGKFFPDLFIHYEYNSNIIERLLGRQDKIIEKCKMKLKEGKKVDPRAFLVMDDCLSSKGNWMRDQPIMEIFMNGRHYYIMYVLTMQFPLGITPELRCNFDYIFLLGEDFISNQKRIFDHYAGMFPDFPSFKQVFTDLTNDYGCMVISNRGARKNFFDKIFWYKADDGKIGSMGSKQFNDFNQNNYNKEWKNKTREFDLSKIAGENKKNKTKIKVEKVKKDEQEIENEIRNNK